MNDMRAKFEEIWPVPEGVCWSEGYGEYMPMNRHSMKHSELACEWDARLDTFTRCQETVSPVMSIIEEMIADIEYLNNDAYGSMQCPSQELIDRAKQILGREK